MSMIDESARTLVSTPHLPIGDGVRVFHRMYLNDPGASEAWSAHCERHGLVSTHGRVTDARESAVAHRDTHVSVTA